MVTKRSRRAAAPLPKSPPLPLLSATTRSVKRSITVRPDVDRALREIAGDREYSQVANEAFVLYVQARGIDAVGRDIEAASGPLTQAEQAEADRRLEDARRRADLRRKTRA